MSQSFDDFLRSQGFNVGHPIIAGAGIQRFANNQKRSKACWAVLFPEGDAGVWGDWHNPSVSHYWRSDGLTRKQLSKEQLQEMERKARLAEKMRDDEYERLASVNLALWDKIEEGIECHYLAEKRVAAHGIKIGLNGNAYVAGCDINGKLWNFQNISSTPKLWQRGRSKGLFHLIEGDRSEIILASGYATGASIHEATGLCVIVCFADGNIPVVAKLLKGAGWKKLRVACDNDCETSQSGNKIFQKVKKELGMACVIPDRHGDFNDLAVSGDNIYSYFYDTVPVFSFEHMMADSSPIPDDVISPRILTQGGMLVFGGAPKVGKSDFMLNWLINMAGGVPFMAMKPSRPLKVFYLQSEVQYPYLKERMGMVEVSPSVVEHVNKNFYVTPQSRLMLDEDGVKKVGQTIRQCFGYDGPDIICIDPIANVYDQESENDNAQMMFFLSQRVEALREYANEKTAFMLIHHTKKIAKDELAKDPFQMFSGASSLRRYYTTGMLMYRPDETVSECVLTYEVRNGPRIKNINIDKDMGRWIIVDQANSRIAKVQENTKYNDEYERKVQVIKGELSHQMTLGNDHTVNSLANLLANEHSLGSYGTVTSVIKSMLAKGQIFVIYIPGSKKEFLTV